MDKNYYPQVLLKELKYLVKKRKIERNFDRDIELTTSSDDSDDEASNEETDEE